MKKQNKCNQNISTKKYIRRDLNTFCWEKGEELYIWVQMQMNGGKLINKLGKFVMFY